MSEYLTVSQYAQASGKDPGNIRRMLIKGILQGEKVGNQWLIPKDAVYPEDGRIRSGRYRNWRQRAKFISKHSDLNKKLCEMCEVIGEIYTNNIDQIVLYGSYARGQETNESDIDMAIVLKSNQTDQQYNQMTDVVVDYELDLGITLSIISIEQNEFEKWKKILPFYKNLVKEGIVLWKNA